MSSRSWTGIQKIFGWQFEKFKIWPNIPYFYAFYSFISEFGGDIGLWAGLDFLTFSHIIFFLLCISLKMIMVLTKKVLIQDQEETPAEPFWSDSMNRDMSSVHAANAETPLVFKLFHLLEQLITCIVNILFVLHLQKLTSWVGRRYVPTIQKEA
jgi:hypothetical protein